MSHAGQVQAVNSRVWAGKDAGEIAFGNQDDLIAPRQPPLDFAEPVIERRKRKFQHHNRIVRAAHVLEQTFEVLLEVCRRCLAQQVVAANFQTTSASATCSAETCFSAEPAFAPLNARLTTSRLCSRAISAGHGSPPR